MNSEKMTWEDFMAGDPLSDNKISSFLDNVEKLETFFNEEIARKEVCEFSYDGFENNKNKEELKVNYSVLLNGDEFELRSITLTYKYIKDNSNIDL